MESHNDKPRKIKHRIFYALIASLLIGNTIAAIINIHSFTRLENVLWLDLYSLLIGIYLWFGNYIITVYLERKYHWLHFPVKRMVYGFLFILLFSFFAIFSFNYIWNLLFTKENFSQYMHDSYYSTILTLILSLLVSLIVNTIIFFRNWRASAINEENLKRERLALQYEALKSQVNPHFLFNSLNVLTSLVYRDPDTSARFIRQLAGVYRYVLEQKDTELTPLSNELSFLDSYIYLHKIRFEDALHTEIINLSGDEDLIIPLSLQMLVENAVKHNIISKEEPLHICVEIDNDYVTVTNNLQRKLVSADSTSIGLQNLKKRYEYLSNKPFEVIETPTEFKVKVPLLKAYK
jgi:sensor histidine kinase YesM